MGTRTVVVLVAVLALAALGLLWVLGGELGARPASSSSSQGVVRPPSGGRLPGPVEAVPPRPGGAPVTPLAERLFGDADGGADEAAVAAATDAAGHRILIGRVVTPDGDPLPGARVHFLPSTATALHLGLGLPDRVLVGSLDRLPTEVTDAAGRFAVSAPHTEPDALTPRQRILAWSNTPAEIVAGAPGFTWQSLALPDHPQGPRQVGDLVLQPSATIVGRVVDANRRPVAGALVGTLPWTPAAPEGSAHRRTLAACGSSGAPPATPEAASCWTACRPAAGAWPWCTTGTSPATPPT